MTGGPQPRARRRATALLAAALVAAPLISGCTPGPAANPQDGPQSSALATVPADQRVRIVAGTTPSDRALAAVLVRHLAHRGVAAEVADPERAPWESAGGRTLAVVDTLAMASALAPEDLAGPVPTPTPTADAGPTGSASASPSASAQASPAAGAADRAPASPSAHPTATESATPLPDGEPATDAGGTTELVEQHFPEDTEAIATSAATLRLQAVTTGAVSGLHGLEELTDLNGLCDRMDFIPAATGSIHADRLEALAGCEPASWLRGDERGPASALVTGGADVALLYGTDPMIPDHALEPLEDPTRILPEGRLLLLADPETLPEGAAGAVQEVTGALTGEGLTELQRIAAGEDALPAEEAAQYWLVTMGLETPPDDWF